MPYKRFKTLALELLERRPEELSSIEFIVYIDADVLIGDNLVPFFRYVKNLYESNLEVESARSTMLMFEEQGKHFIKRFHKNNTVFHGGIMALHRPSSQGCLDVWRSMMDINRWKYDMGALANLLYVNESTKSMCHVEELDRKFFFLLLDHKMERGESGVFVHITNTRLRLTSKDIRRNYLQCSLMLDLAD